MPAPFTRGRLSVNLSPARATARGLQTLGTVESKGETRFLGVDSAGEYWAFAPGARPLPLPAAKVQSAIAAAATGMRATSQADRMAANAERKRLNAKTGVDAPTPLPTEKTR